MPLVKARALLRVAAVAVVMPLVKARALLRVAAVNQLRLLLPSKQ